jgi:hypothetical protein
VLLDPTIALLGSRSEGEDRHPDIDRLENERRFLPTSAQLDVFIEAVIAGPLPEANKIPQAATTTWTTYLDTKDGLCFLSCDGPTARRLRVREYEGLPAQGGAALCYLELKQTMGTSRSKVRLAAPIATLAGLIDGASDADRFFTDPVTRSVALGTIRQALAGGHFAPCVGTSYRRRCLASGPELRVTLDEDLTFFHPVSFGAPHDNREALAVGPSRVLEVKYAGSLPGWLARACDELNEAPVFSKFRLGMLAVRQAMSIAAGPTNAMFREPFRDAATSASRFARKSTAI